MFFSPALWQYIGWVTLAAVVICIVVLSVLLLLDSRKTEATKNVALPSLGPASTEDEEAIFDADSKDLATDSRASRRSRRAKRQSPADYNNGEVKESASFFDDDDEFTLTGGKD